MFQEKTRSVEKNRFEIFEFFVLISEQSYNSLL